MAIEKELLDQLLAGRDAHEVFARDGLLDELKKALSERMLSAELDDHLESEGAEGVTNRRNGSSRKTMLTGTSKVTLDVPRDRAGTFDPQLIAKYQRRFPDFDGLDDIGVAPVYTAVLHDHNRHFPVSNRQNQLGPLTFSPWPNSTDRW